MAEATHIQPMGNQMAILFNDGSKKLAYPTSTDMFIIGAPGEVPPPPPTGTRFIWPFSLSLVTSEFGMRWGRLHAGIDFGKGEANRPGTPIKASAAGKVLISTDSHSGYGIAVVLDHGGGLCTLYGHMNPGSRAVSVGQTVTQGQTLGGIGNTGASQGYHLHFETHEGGYRWNASARDPRVFFKKYNV